MKIEDAIVYCLATSNRGMRTEQIADMINRQRLYLRKDGQPVTTSADTIFYQMRHAINQTIVYLVCLKIKSYCLFTELKRTHDFISLSSIFSIIL